MTWKTANLGFKFPLLICVWDFLLADTSVLQTKGGRQQFILAFIWQNWISPSSKSLFLVTTLPLLSDILAMLSPFPFWSLFVKISSPTQGHPSSFKPLSLAYRCFHGHRSRPLRKNRYPWASSVCALISSQHHLPKYLGCVHQERFRERQS